MCFFSAFLSFALIVCVLSISPTYGFTKGQHCSSLFNDINFAGDKFDITEGSSFSNLGNEYLDADTVWNLTLSFLVETGCTLKACNDSFFGGECRDFSEELTNLPKPFKNILSVSCSCPRACKCEDVHIVRKKSCARAYLFAGGCNKCEPYYADLEIGRANTFPEDFETEVSSLMVRQGCQLTVHDEPELLGDPQSVKEIVEKWTTPLRSYECWCDEVDLNPPNPTERPTHYPPLIDIPDSLDQISAMMKGDFPIHPGLLAALQSSRGKRSNKNAYILLLGSTGAGKSSTINMLFDSQLVGTRTSSTKQIHEFRVRVPVDEFGISNSELRVIDTPGLGGTKGLKHDAKLLATLEEFLDSHEELKDRIPNVVLIFHKFSDNRFSGNGSNFIKMIRGLDTFRDRLTDKKYSNVIFVFSHFTSETKKISKNPKLKLRKFMKVIEEFSNFPRPSVWAVAENKVAEQELFMMNGYYRLPNGDFYPKNLFDRITQVTRGGGDTIGGVVIGSAFSNPRIFNITQVNFSLETRERTKIPKYLAILTAAPFPVNKTELSRNLTVAHETMSPELKKRFPDALYNLQKSLIVGNYLTVADLPQTTPGIVKLLSGLRQNDAVLYLLKKAFDISPPILKENILAGYSYNVFKDQPLSVSPLELGDLQTSNLGYKFPAIITTNVDFKSKDILYLFKNRQEYLDERMRSLNIGGMISLESFTAAPKPGYNIYDQISSPDGKLTAPITAVRVHKTFELVLNDDFTLTNEFKNAVDGLSPYNASDHGSVDQWKAFFNEYGTHVVQAVYGGGAIEVEIKAKDKLSSDTQLVLKSFIQFPEGISLGKVGNSSLNDGIEHSLRFVGGDKNYQSVDLAKMSVQEAAGLLEKWKESLRLSPKILTYVMGLLPISEITKRLGHNISSEIDRATNLLFNSSFVNTRPTPASHNLPGEDRSSVHLQQTTEMFSEFMERMAKHVKESNERCKGTMLSMRKRQEEARELQQQIHLQQLKEFEQETALDADKKILEGELKLQNLQKEQEEARELQQQTHLQQLSELEQKAASDADKKTLEQELKLQNMQKQHEEQEMRLEQVIEAYRGHYKYAPTPKKTHAEEIEILKNNLNNPRNQNRPEYRPAPGGCLREGTQILMADFTEKRVELLEAGEMILDHKLAPVRVSGVLKKFLLSDKFHGFDNQTFFFTDTHQLVGPTTCGDDLQVYVKELSKTLLENPLLAYLNVQALPKRTEILRHHPATNTVFPEQVTVFSDPTTHSLTTPVFIILVESKSGTYFANGFLCRHEIPPLQHWPRTLSVLFSLAAEPEIKWIENLPYNLETVGKIENIVNGGYLRLQEILKEEEEGIMEDGVASEGLSLSEQVILDIFDNPTFSAFAVGMYGKLGPALAQKLEVGDSIRSEIQIRRLQFVVYQGLKEYFAKSLNEAFNCYNFP